MIESVETLEGSISGIADLNGELSIDNIYIEPIVQEKSVAPTTEVQEVVPDEGYTGLSKVTINAIEDENLVPENIKRGVNILGVEGTMVGGKYAPRYIKQCPTFEGYSGAELDDEITKLDTSAFTKMNNMFYNCKNLISLDLSEWNTSNVTDMGNMFRNCQALTELDLSNFDTSNVTSMSSTFENCSNLKRLNISSWKTDNLQNTTYMFNNCSNLEFIDMRNFTFDNLTSYRNMFTQVNYYCEIIVKNETQKQWLLSQRNFPNAKTVAEYEVM